ncbi:MAG: ribbon-helix-helix protein, CopG family [Candidatus Brocadiales bacterium]
MTTFTLKLSPSAVKVLDELAVKMGKTKAEVLRASIATLDVLQEAKEQHKKFGITGKDGTLEKELILT